MRVFSENIIYVVSKWTDERINTFFRLANHSVVALHDGPSIATSLYKSSKRILKKHSLNSFSNRRSGVVFVGIVYFLVGN